MALRRQVSERAAKYALPWMGVNLRSAEIDLRDGEARLMQNCFYDGGVSVRTGSNRLHTATLGASLRIRGGHKFYYGGASPTSKRLIAYGTKISTLSDAGIETVLTSGMTNDLDTHFATWSIPDKVYISNPTDVLRSYDGTTFATVTGTAIPVARTAVVPVLDRLLAVTTNGIERTDPRTQSVWSFNSSWATFRPSKVGLFTALAPFTVRGTDTLYPGAIAMQANAYYLITGTDFGTDVTAAAASAGHDASIRLLDATVGTSSPYSVAAVPGVGLFWVTSDLNVYLLPEGSLTGRYVGDKLQSFGTTPGLESLNKAAIGQVTMTYFDRKLWLGYPTGSNTFCSRYWWMDVRRFMERPDLGPVWYGPMTGPTTSRFWAELQNGDNRLIAGDGNPTTGAFVYEMLYAGRYTDAVGTADNSIVMALQTYFNDSGYPSRNKYLRAVHLDLSTFTGSATVDILDLDGVVATGLPVVAVT